MAKDLNKIGLGGLAFGHLAIDMQTASLAMMTPLLLTHFRLDYGAAALIITVNNLASYALQPIFGIASDRRPLRWLLPLGCILAAGAMITVLFMPSYWLVLLAVALSGIGAAMYHPEGSRNANYVSGDRKATAMSFFFFSGNLGQAIGPIALTVLLGVFGTSGALVMLVPGIVGGLLLWRLQPLFAHYAAERNGSRKVGRVSRFGQLTPRKTGGLLGMLLSLIALRSMIQTGLITFVPLYFVSRAGGSKEYAAFLLSVFVLASAFGTLIGGPLSDRLGYKTVMVSSLTLVGPLLLAFFNTSGLAQVIIIGLAGVSLVAASSLTVVLAQELLPNNVGLATGLTLGLGFGAGGIGASVLGKLADGIGLPQTLLVLTVLPIPAILLSLALPFAPRVTGLKPAEPTRRELEEVNGSL